MSRTLRIIDGIIIALLIIAAVLTYLPQLFGICTVAVGTDMLGNVEVGSLIYTEEEPTTSVQKGDEILNLTDNSASIYTVTSYDPSAGTVDVEGGEETTYKLSENYLRVTAVIPYVGYFSVAVQSRKGLIMLAVIVVYVILSLIVAALIKKKDDDDDDDYYSDEDDEDEDEFYSRLAEKKKKRDAERYGDDDVKDRHKKKKNKKDRRNKNKKKKEDDGYDDEDEEEDDEEDTGDGMKEISADKKTVPGAAADETEPDVSEESLTDVQAALEAALDTQPLNHTEEIPAGAVNAASKIGDLVETDENETGVNENGEIELAMPVRTADEILSKAYSAGLDPTVEEDKSTGVTLVDYSDSL